MQVASVVVEPGGLNRERSWLEGYPIGYGSSNEPQHIIAGWHGLYAQILFMLYLCAPSRSHLVHACWRMCIHMGSSVFRHVHISACVQMPPLQFTVHACK